MTKPRIWKTDPESIPSEALTEVASVIARGGLVIYPTETFYALGGAPLLPGVPARIFASKGRDPGKPLPLIAANLEAVFSSVREWPSLAQVLADAFWPGPLTLLLPASASIPPDLHAGTEKVAIRISSHPLATLLASIAGGILISTSANLSGDPPPSDPRGIPGELLEKVEGFLDAGILSGGLPSTIVDVTFSQPRLVRAGALAWDLIARTASLSG